MSTAPWNATAAQLLEELFYRAKHGRGSTRFAGWGRYEIIEELGKRIDASQGDGK